MDMNLWLYIRLIYRWFVLYDPSSQYIEFNSDAGRVV